MSSERHAGLGLPAARWSAPFGAFGGDMCPRGRITQQDVKGREYSAVNDEMEQFRSAPDYRALGGASRKDAGSGGEVPTR